MALFQMGTDIIRHVDAEGLLDRLFQYLTCGLLEAVDADGNVAIVDPWEIPVRYGLNGCPERDRQTLGIAERLDGRLRTVHTYNDPAP